MRTASRLCNCLIIMAALPRQGESKPVMAPRVVWRQTEGLLILGDGLIPAIQIVVLIAKGIAKGKCFGSQRQGRAVEPDRLDRFGLMVERIAHLDVHPEVGRIGRRHARHERIGFDVFGPQASPEYGEELRRLLGHGHAMRKLFSDSVFSQVS